MNYSSLERAIKALSRRQPFRPYQIKFINGQRLFVTHSEGVRPDPEYLYFVNPQSDYQVFDNTTVCRVLDVASDAAG